MHSVMERKSLVSSCSLLPLPSQMLLETHELELEVPFQSCALCFKGIVLLSTKKGKRRAPKQLFKTQHIYPKNECTVTLIS